MDTTVPHGYPIESSGIEIKNTIKDLASDIEKNPDNNTMVLHHSALIQLGQAELSRRFARKNTVLVLTISILSIILSSIAVLSGIENNTASKEWRDQQLHVLNTIEQSLGK